MTLRNDKVSGTLTCALGIGMVLLASFGLIIVFLQRSLISTMPPVMRNPNGPSFASAAHAIHGVWLVYLPLMIVAGVIFATAGFYVRRGSLPARRIAQANAILGFVWLIAYAISCYQIMPIIGPPPDMLPESARSMIKWFSIVVGTFMGAAFPTGLLYVLSRPTEHADRTASPLNTTPTIQRERAIVKLTDAAVARFKESLASEPHSHIRLSVKREGPTGYMYDLDFADQLNPSDFVDKSYGFTMAVDSESSIHLEGATIDWCTTSDGRTGFLFDNPNAVKI